MLRLKFYLFADDTNMLYADQNLKSLETVVNCELLSVYNLLIANKLWLNIEKCNFFIFNRDDKRPNYKLNLKLFDHYSFIDSFLWNAKT